MAVATTVKKTQKRKKAAKQEAVPAAAPEKVEKYAETAPPPQPEVKVEVATPEKAEKPTGKKRKKKTSVETAGVSRLAGRRRAIALAVAELGPGLYRASEYVAEINGKLKSQGYKPTNAVGVLHVLEALKERGLEFDRLKGTIYAVDTAKLKL